MYFCWCISIATLLSVKQYLTQIQGSHTPLILAGWYNHKTAPRQRHKKKKHVHPHNAAWKTGSQRLQYVATHNCTASGFCVAFRFQGLLASTLSIPGALLVTYNRWYHTVCCHKIHIYYTHFIRDFGGITVAADYIITYLKGLNKTTITSTETCGL